MESSDVFWREESRGDTAGSRPGKSGEAERESTRGKSLLDLQSLIDRLFIDLV